MESKRVPNCGATSLELNLDAGFVKWIEREGAEERKCTKGHTGWSIVSTTSLLVSTVLGVDSSELRF